jgi:hypothetical protein
VDQETREALERLEHGLRTDIAASEDRTRAQFEEVHNRIAASEDRTRVQFEEVRNLIAASEDRTRRHFDVVAESLRGDIRSLAEGVMVVAEGSLRRDAELGERVDRLEHRVLGVESRVSGLEGSRRRRRRR